MSKKPRSYVRFGKSGKMAFAHRSWLHNLLPARLPDDGGYWNCSAHDLHYNLAMKYGLKSIISEHLSIPFTDADTHHCLWCSLAGVPDL